MTIRIHFFKNSLILKLDEFKKWVCQFQCSTTSMTLPTIEILFQAVYLSIQHTMNINLEWEVIYLSFVSIVLVHNPHISIKVLKTWISLHQPASELNLRITFVINTKAFLYFFSLFTYLSFLVHLCLIVKQLNIVHCLNQYGLIVISFQFGLQSSRIGLSNFCVIVLFMFCSFLCFPV